MVSFTTNGRLIGEASKNSITHNYKNTIYDAKRLIGRKFSEKVVQKDKNLWSFKIKKDIKSERSIIEIENSGKKSDY